MLVDDWDDWDDGCEYGGWSLALRQSNEMGLWRCEWNGFNNGVAVDLAGVTVLAR